MYIQARGNPDTADAEVVAVPVNHPDGMKHDSITAVTEQAPVTNERDCLDPAVASAEDHSSLLDEYLLDDIEPDLQDIEQCLGRQIHTLDGLRPRSNSTDGELNLPHPGLCDEREVLENYQWRQVARQLPPRGLNNLGNTCFLNSESSSSESRMSTKKVNQEEVDRQH